MDIATHEPTVIMRMDCHDILFVIDGVAAEVLEAEALGDDALDFWEAVWILRPGGAVAEALWEEDWAWLADWEFTLAASIWASLPTPHGIFSP